MASLHKATGAPVAFDPRVSHAHPPSQLSAHHPFSRAEAPPPLRPANQGAPLAESLEVTVLWGSSVLAVAQLTPPRAYAVGEVGGAGGAGVSALGRVDFALEGDRLGSARRELVALRGGRPFAIFGADERPRVIEAGELVDMSGIVSDCSDVAFGARGVELRQGRVVVIEASGICFRLAGSEKPAQLARSLLGSTDRSAIATMGTAATLQALFIATLAYLTPSMAGAATDELNNDRLALMQQYLRASAERNREEEPARAEDAGGEKSAPAAAARGPAGASGRAEAPPTPRRLAIQGDRAERIVSRHELRAEAENFGMVGMLSALNTSNAPSAPWGADLAIGADAVNAHGDLFSRELGDAFGHGLALSGTGEGGDGSSVGVGLDRIGSGTCLGVSCLNGNFGGSIGRLGRTHQTVGPRIRTSVTTVSGRLPSDVIQRIVRQNFGRFRQCYETGLRANPNLEGRVTARFVIGRDGAVSNVSAGGDLPDAKVSSCVASAFYGLTFPAPENGIVTVSYPILLTPG